MMPAMKYLRSFLVIIVGIFLSGAAKADRSSEQAYGSGRMTKFTSQSAVDAADNPADLSAQGWKAALLRTKQALKDKQISTQAAALGYYTTLTFFPALLGAATVFATFAGPHRLLDVIDNLKGLVPPAIYDVIHQQLTPLTTVHRGSLGIAAVISVAALLWTTSGGLQNLIKATNVAYEVDESRGLIKLRLLSIVLSLVLLILGAIIVILLVLRHGALQQLGFPDWAATLFPYVRWILLVIVLSLVLSVVYRYAPDRKAPRWSWVSWGATAATIIWLVGTALFFLYAQHFGNFNKTYGIFAGIIILMTWFNLSGFIILIGAQVNKKLEEVTDIDTQQ